MPPCKIAMRLIENTRARALTYSKRTKGLKKAEELATFCRVPVAPVCAGAAGAPLVWELEEGVLDRYRALPPEVRGQHTHRNYLEGELGKERAKLSRVHQDGPGAQRHNAGRGAGAARETIDAALRATSEWLEALGLPADGQLEQIAPGAYDAVMPLLGHGGVPCTTGSNLVDMDAGFLQMMPGHGNNDRDGWLDQFSWDDRFQMHNAEMMPPGYGLQCTGGNYLGAVDDYGQMQAPGYGNAHYGCPGLTIWHTDESCNAVLPVGYYPSLGIGGDDGTPARRLSTLPWAPAATTSTHHHPRSPWAWVRTSWPPRSSSAPTPASARQLHHLSVWIPGHVVPANSSIISTGKVPCIATE